MKKLLNGLTSVENVIMVAAFAIMVICTFTQVLNRNFFKLSMPWLDEASTYSMIFMALIGTEVGLRDGTQISVTAVVDKFYGRTRQVIMIVAKIVVLGIRADFFHQAGGTPARYRPDFFGNGSAHGGSVLRPGDQLCDDRVCADHHHHKNDRPAQRSER